MILLLFIPGIPAEVENLNPYDQDIITSSRGTAANITANRSFSTDITSTRQIDDNITTTRTLVAA